MTRTWRCSVGSGRESLLPASPCLRIEFLPRRRRLRRIDGRSDRPAVHSVALREATKRDAPPKSRRITSINSTRERGAGSTGESRYSQFSHPVGRIRRQSQPGDVRVS
jgi:hypothetical protein